MMVDRREVRRTRAINQRGEVMSRAGMARIESATFMRVRDLLFDHHHTVCWVLCAPYLRLLRAACLAGSSHVFLAAHAVDRSASILRCSYWFRTFPGSIYCYPIVSEAETRA